MMASFGDSLHDGHMLSTMSHSPVSQRRTISSSKTYPQVSLSLILTPSSTVNALDNLSARSQHPLCLPNTSANELTERLDFLVSELLTRFQNIVKLAPTPQGATKEVVAQQTFQSKVETAALVKAAEDLLKLSRELKELWLFGPLRDLGEGESNSQMDQDAAQVEQMVTNILQRVNDMGVKA